MDEEEGTEAMRKALRWTKEPEQHLVDIMVGSAFAGGILRMVVGEYVFNPEAGADKPAIRPVVSLAMPASAARKFAADIVATLDDYEKDTATDA